MADPQREARTPLGVIHSNFAAAPAGQGTRRSKPASRGSQPGGGAGSAVAQTRIPKPTPPPQSQPRAPGTAYSVAAGPSKPHPTASQPQHTPAPSFALYDNPSFDSPHYDLRAEHSEGLTPGFLAEDAPGSSHVSEWLSSVSPLAQRTASRVDAAAPECETPLAPRQGRAGGSGLLPTPEARSILGHIHRGGQAAEGRSVLGEDRHACERMHRRICVKPLTRRLESSTQYRIPHTALLCRHGATGEHLPAHGSPDALA